MINDFYKYSKYYFLTIILLLLTFIFIKMFFSVELLTVDTKIHDYILKMFSNKYLTIIFKCITNMGSFIFYLVCLFVLSRLNKNVYNLTKYSLFFTFLISTLFKNIIRRGRPSSALVEMPIDYSFPSGHTLHAVVFYGMLIIFVNKYIKNKNFKIFLRIVLTSLILLIGLSRIYLGVHFVSDVLVGYLLGFILLKMFINFYKEYDLV